MAPTHKTKCNLCQKQNKKYNLINHIKLNLIILFHSRNDMHNIYFIKIKKSSTISKHYVTPFE